MLLSIQMDYVKLALFLVYLIHEIRDNHAAERRQIVVIIARGKIICIATAGLTIPAMSRTLLGYMMPAATRILAEATETSFMFSRPNREKFKVTAVDDANPPKKPVTINPRFGPAIFTPK